MTEILALLSVLLHSRFYKYKLFAAPEQNDHPLSATRICLFTYTLKLFSIFGNHLYHPQSDDALQCADRN